METIYLIPAETNDLKQVINVRTFNDYDKYITGLKKFIDHTGYKNKRLVCSGDWGSFKYEDIPYSFCSSEFIEYEFFYKLKLIKLITHEVFFKYGYFRQLRSSDVNQTMVMLDHFGLDVHSLHNTYESHKSSLKKIPEIIQGRRYVLHNIREFFELDFKEYFNQFENSEYLDKEIFKANISNWQRLLLCRSDSSSRIHLWNKTGYKKIKDFLCDTTARNGIKLFSEMIYGHKHEDYIDTYIF